MKRRGALVAAAAMAGVLALPHAGGAAPDPTFTATPNPVALGGRIQLTITDCPGVDPSTVAVGIEVRFQDTPGGGVFLEETTPGTWVGTLDVGSGYWADDVTLHPHCGSWDGAFVTVDVDNPRLLATPFYVPPITRPDPPEGFFGTDCPPGTTAHVFFQAVGRPAPESRTAAIDDRGDWEVTVPDFPRGTAVEVDASCGAVSYPVYSYTAGGSQYATTTTSLVGDPGPSSTTTTAAAPGSNAAPATPVAGSAAYTG